MKYNYKKQGKNYIQRQITKSNRTSIINPIIKNLSITFILLLAMFSISYAADGHLGTNLWTVDEIEATNITATNITTENLTATDTITVNTIKATYIEGSTWTDSQNLGEYSATNGTDSNFTKHYSNGYLLTKPYDVVVCRTDDSGCDIVCTDSDCSDEIETQTLIKNNSIYIKSGEYPTDNVIDVESFVKIIADGNSTIIKANTDQLTIFNISGRNGVIIKDIALDGNNHTTRNILLVNTNYSVFENIWLYPVRGPGRSIYLQDDSNHNEFSKIFIFMQNWNDGFAVDGNFNTFRDSHIYSSGNTLGYGVYIRKGDYNNIINVHSDGAEHGICIAEYESNYNTISHCHATGCDKNGITLSAPLGGISSHNNLINNHAYNNGDYGIAIGAANTTIVSGNHIYNNGVAGIRLYNTTNYTYFDNNICENNTHYCIWIQPGTTHYYGFVDDDLYIEDKIYCDTIVINGEEITGTTVDVSSSGLFFASNFNNASVLDSTVFDSSGHNYHAINYGATFNQGGGFNSGDYFDFDGNTDYLEINNFPSFNNVLTLESWIRRNDSTIGGIISRDDGSNRPYVMRIIANGELYCSLRNGTTVYTTSSGTKCALDTWCHIACVWDGSTIQGYVNGKAKGTPIGFTNITTQTAPLRIGRYYATGGQFNGSIDEIHVWNRSLSSSEINKNYLKKFESINSFVSQKNIKINLSGIYPQNNLDFLGSYGINNINALTATANLDIGNYNLTADNVFIPADIFIHTDATIAVGSAGVWYNITWTHTNGDPKQNIQHVYDDNTNDTITINDAGTYNIKYSGCFNDTAANPSGFVYMRIAVNGEEIHGSGFGKDTKKQNEHITMGHWAHVDLSVGDEVKIQFTSTDTTVSMEVSSDVYLDHVDSATVSMERIR